MVLAALCRDTGVRGSKKTSDPGILLSMEFNSAFFVIAHFIREH